MKLPTSRNQTEALQELPAIQFDSTIDGKAIKIALMVDEHTRRLLLNIV